MQVLIVDDDRVTLSLLEDTLKKEGYETITATDGETAWELLRRGDSHLVITDWYMPKMDGLELCKKIRSAKFPTYIYVILLTSHDRRQDIISGLLAGADDFLTKPFDSAELVLRLAIGKRILSMETRDVTIFALAKLAESRDTETGFHLERIRNYCRILTQALGNQDKFKDIITPEYEEIIYRTSPLHDIGKVSIPDCVLLKPDRLNEQEWDIMKTHTDKGAQTLEAAIKEYPGIAYLEIARDIAWCHHEKYNGTGYPRGLKGEQIPLSGRIVALADVYDALVSKRVYKEAFSHWVARSIILENKGAHFDPDIVDTFLANDELFLKISAGGFGL